VSFNAVEIIGSKRDGRVLSDEAIAWILNTYNAGGVAEEQMSSLLMAIFFNGLNAEELNTWTDVMINSGERLSLSGLSRPTVDKHSTGGVGDKISLILAPLVAACGAAVPQLSGRGLGHTGGTLDKLEAIPGWRAFLSNEEVRAQLESVGAVICAAGQGMAPIDRKLYSLRDVTATVESIPLIASSIMSKKIAEGTEALVLDVKVGRGAFMKDRDRARTLAQTMVRIGTQHGVKTVAQLTNMDVPLGIAAGNALEVIESVEVLRGGGPQDVRDLTVALADAMLELVGISANPAEMLDNGKAYDTYRSMISAQGGDPDYEFPKAAKFETYEAPQAGIVNRLDALGVGVIAWRLGAGRARKEDSVSAAAGVRVLVREGDSVEKGQPLLELHADDDIHMQAGRDALSGSILINDEMPTLTPLLIEQVRE
jgi:thymidine phosphorylase